MKLKGALKNLSYRKLFLSLGAVGFALVLLRIWQVLFLLDPDSGFFKEKNDLTVLPFYVLAIGLTLAALLLFYLAGDAGAVFRMRRSVPHGIACLLTAAAVGADALTKQTGAVTGGSAGLQKAYTVSAFAAALVFLLDGVVFLSGAAFGKKLRILRLVPVLWAFFLTIGYFAVTASYLHSTQLMLTIFGDAFLMIYLFEYARKAAGINAAENSAVFCATGLVAAVLLTAASLPALLLKLTAGAQIAYCPFLWYHLACAAFCVTSLCLRREDADAADAPVPTAPFPAEDAPAEAAPAQDAPEA